MFPWQLRMAGVVFCLVGVTISDGDAQEPSDRSRTVAVSHPLEGLWSGSWGGGARNGVVFQPVIAELFIQGRQTELTGFRNLDGLTGTIRIDKLGNKLHITPNGEDGGEPAPAIAFNYELKGDELTLNDRSGFRTTLIRIPVALDPPLQARVEFISSTGINDAGDLLVTEFTELKVGRAGHTYYQPVQRALKTRQAIVILVQETDWKKVTIAEARRLIQRSTPVAVTYRDVDRPLNRQVHQLWKNTGDPPPDREAVWRTLSRTLRPGTLVFVLKREPAPPP